MIKLVVFDMDGTLLKGRTVDYLHKKYKVLGDFDENDFEYEISRKIANNLKGVHISELKSLERTIPITKGVKETLRKLRLCGIKIAMISLSYEPMVEEIGKKLGIKYFFGGKLKIKNGKVSGGLKKPDWPKNKSCENHPVCKLKIMKLLKKKFSLKKNEVAAIGDRESDICMLKEAGLKIAFCASKKLKKCADVVIEKRDMRLILPHVLKSL